MLGEPGIGKSRLADEVASRAAKREMGVVWGRTWEAGGAPAYWPWTQALRATMAGMAPDVLGDKLGSRLERLADILPELRAKLPGFDSRSGSAFDSADARFYFFDAVTSFLRHAASERPLLVVLEDIHRADRPSLLLLQFLTRGLSKLPIALVATAREFEVRSQPELARLVDDIARDGVSIALGGLSLEDTGTLVDASLGSVPPPNVVESLHRLTDGNPYWLVELARGIRAELGSRPMIEWQTIRLPADLRRAIGRSLDHLGPECRRVLSIASVAGREFTLAPVREVAGLADAPLLDALAEAERAGLVRSTERHGNRRSFTHALVRETLYEELPPVKRARLHREIGRSLERLSSPDRSAHTAEIAHHFFEAAWRARPRRGHRIRAACRRASVRATRV